MASPDDLDRRLADLERTVRRLEDEGLVRDLVAEYQRLCDGGWAGRSHADPDALAALFTADALYSVSTPEPPCRGTAEIRAKFEQLGRTRSWIIHFLANPVVRVEGDTATGELKGFVHLFLDDTPQWRFGTYHGDFVRTPEGWRFSSLRFVRAELPR